MRRVVIGGTHSGSGKTTVALALMKTLKLRGKTVAPFKVGPDYIDPGFHRFVCDRPSYNLDAHLMDDEAIRQTLSYGMRGADIGVIEGVMGYYDGIGAGFTGSTHDMARGTNMPALLVVDAAGSATSAAAEALGFLKLNEPSGIAGVIVNRVSGDRHYQLVREAVERHTSLPCVGYLKKDASLHLSSRHLGLIPAEEVKTLNEQVERAAELLTMDFAAFDAITDGVPEIKAKPMPTAQGMRGYRLGVARDEAFSFYYEANLDLMRLSGMELIPFSPLRDINLPENLDGLYIGGGFPEVFAERLSDNALMRGSIKAALQNGLRCYAECGGMMYLSRSIGGHDMVGFLPARCEMTEKLQRFGYVIIEDEERRVYPAHEFHRSIFQPEEEIETIFTARKMAAPEKRWRTGYRVGNTLAGYPHLHFLSHPELINRLWKEALI